MLVRALRDFFFPAHCLICNGAIDDGLVCDDCLDLVVEIGPPLCPRCGRPTKKDRRCRRCKDQSLDRVRGWGYYQPPLDKIIHQFKYDDRRSIARLLGRKVSTVIRSDPEYREIDLIIPIPLHKRREKERGYNQSELLAQELGRELHLPVERGLVRIRNNRSQTGLTDQERKENVRGIFRLDSEIEGLNILLVDDVMTTGSTIEEAASVIKAAGAKAALGAVAAIAP